MGRRVGGWPRAIAARLIGSPIAGPGLATLAAIGVGTAAAFLGQMMISRRLGVGPYGAYSMLVGWSMLAVLPASLGLDAAIMRFMPIYLGERATGRYRRLIRFVLSAQLGGIALMVGLLFAGGVAGIATLGWARTATLVWAALLIGTTVLGNTAAAILQAGRRVIVAQIFLTAVRPILVVLLVATLFVARPAAYGATDLFGVTAIAATLAVAALGTYVLRRFFRGPAAENASPSRRPWLSFGLFYLGAGAGQQGLVQFPILIVGMLAGDAQAGHYGVVSRLASTVSVGLSTFATVSMPLIATAFAAEDRREVRRIARTNARLSFAFAVAATVVIALAGRWLLGFFGAGFVDAYPVLLILMIGLTASASLGAATAVVVMSGRPAVVATANATGVVVLVAVACLCVPLWGAAGGALAYAAAVVVALGIIAGFAYWRLGIDTTILAR